MGIYRHPRTNALRVGKTAPGSRLYFYEPGDTIPKAVTDAGGTPLSNPVIADENGIFAAVYGTGRYKVVQEDSTGGTLTTDDNIDFDPELNQVQFVVDVVDDSDDVSLDSLYETVGAFDGQQVFVKGYYAAGDGGGGAFYWNAASTDADDGGVTILPTGHVGAGRWKRIHDGVLSVLWFGAKGDGSTDDTTVIQACLDVGLPVYFPGTDNYYKVSIAPTLNTNQRVYGDGRRSQIRQVTANANVLSSTNSGVIVENLLLYAVGSKSSISDGSGILLNGISDYTVRNCVVQNHRGSGVVAIDCNDGEIVGNWFESSPVINSDLHTATASDISVYDNSKRNTITGNFCVSGQANGITIQTTGVSDDADDNVVLGNHVENAKSYGIIVYRGSATVSGGLKRNIVSNNTIFNVTGAVQDATFGYVYGAGIYNQGAEHTVISNNSLKDTHSAAVTFIDQLAPGAIGSLNASVVVIDGNTVENAGMWGITVRDPTGLGASTGSAVVSNNNVDTTVKDGIEVREKDRTIVDGNSVNNASGSVGGIAVTNTVTKRDAIEISNNTIITSSANGITVGFAAAPLIAGNSVRDSSVHGISVNNANDPLITSNIVVDHTTRGIEIEATCDRGLLDGNYVYGDGSSVIGIRVNANVQIGENVVENSVTEWDGTYKPGRALPVDDATPSVLRGKLFTTANTVATTITNFDDGYDGQTIHVIVRDTNTTFDFTASSLRGNNGVDLVAANNDSLHCVYDATLNGWYCTVGLG